MFLVGDSQVASFSHVLNNQLKKINHNLIDLTFGNGCYYALGFNLDGFCDAQSQENRKTEIFKKPGSIIILGYTSTFANSDQREKALISIKELLENNYKVFFVYPHTTYPENISVLLKKKFFNDRDFFLKNENFVLSIDYDSYKETFKDTIKFLDIIDHKNIRRVKQSDLFCDKIFKSKCFFNDNNNIYTVDRSHPSSHAANLIVNKIIKEILNF